MNKKQWIVIVPIMGAVMAAMLALALGVGSAFAQDQGQSQEQAGQGGPGRGQLRKHMIAGEVVKVEDNTITVKTRRNDEEKAVKVDDQTRYRKDGKDASLDDVKAGEQVALLIGAKPAEGEDPTAKAVIIGRPPAQGQGGADRKAVVGTLSAINGDTLTIKTEQGDKQVKIPALTQGMRIAVVTGPDGSVRGVMYNPPEKPQGEPAAPPEDQPPA
jgi:hypothetical protein